MDLIHSNRTRGMFVDNGFIILFSQNEHKFTNIMIVVHLTSMQPLHLAFASAHARLQFLFSLCSISLTANANLRSTTIFLGCRRCF